MDLPKEINFKIQNIKKILLIGAGGKTGKSFTNLLLSHDKIIYAYDSNPDYAYPEHLQSHHNFHIVSIDDYNSFNVLNDVNSVTLSPGVPLSSEIIKKANMSGKVIFSELEYCFEFLKDKEWICVTGTDGKSTTVALIEHLINETGENALACGNYGLPFSEILCNKDKYKDIKYLVAELSSYQLEMARNLTPYVAIYLNLSTDHLNRYESLHHYGLVKWNVFRNVLPGGKAIGNINLLNKYWRQSRAGMPTSLDLARDGFSSVSLNDLSSQHYHWVDGTLKERLSGEEIVNTKMMHLTGKHNQSNVLFAMEVIHHLKLSQPEKVKSSLSSFQPLPHRFERIYREYHSKDTNKINKDKNNDNNDNNKGNSKGENNNDENIYINDSKATTTQATILAISNCKEPLFIFLGGQSKGEDYKPVGESLQGKVCKVFLFGENQNEIARALDECNVAVAVCMPSLDEVFLYARDLQIELGWRTVTYLLAPASTSWDQYESFEARGEHFRRLVNKTSIH